MSELDSIHPDAWDNLRDNFYKTRKPSQEMNDYIAERAKKVKIAEDKYNEWLKVWKETRRASEDKQASEDTEDTTEEMDAVHKPAHYNVGSIEAIDYIKQQTGDGFRDYLYGNAMKYMHRHRYKGKPVECLKKAQWYLARLIEEEIKINEL
jgi:hypothetical protein